MTRKKYTIGNWKMNLGLENALALITEAGGMLQDEYTHSADKQVVVCTPMPYIMPVNKLCTTQKYPIQVGAQNCSEHASGAYTGETSAMMLSQVGAQYVIIGHSERRKYQQESNEVLALKTNIALQNGLTPIFCIGETQTERENDTYFEVIEKQLEAGIFHLSEAEFKKIIIAYEPVWAIGTGLTASPAQAQAMHAYIRQTIEKQYNTSLANATSILYGGSCNAANAAELFACKDIDGGLIGGASLKSRDFAEIAKAM